MTDQITETRQSALFAELHLAGRMLCLMLLLLPALGCLLYPNDEKTWQYFTFNGLISFSELLFISIWILQRRPKNYHLNMIPIYLWAAFLLWAAVALSHLSSAPNPTDAQTITSQYFIHFFFFVTMTSYLQTQPSASAALLRALCAGLIIFLPVFWFRLYGTYEQPTFDWTWSLPGFRNVRHLDYYLGALAALLGILPVMLKSYSQIYRLLFWSLLSGCWVMLFWSGGRGSTIAAAAAIMSILLMFRPDGWKKILIFNIALFFCAAAVSVFLPAPNGSYGILRFLTKFTETESFDEFSAGRLKIWLEAFHIWQQNLWIGIGAGQTRTVIAAAHGSFAQPHNVFLQALMSWGLLGGLPFLGGLFLFFWKRTRIFLFESQNPNPVNLVGFSIALTLAINALVDGTLYYPTPLFLFIIGITIAGAPSRPSR